MESTGRSEIKVFARSTNLRNNIGVGGAHHARPRDADLLREQGGRLRRPWLVDLKQWSVTYDHMVITHLPYHMSQVDIPFLRSQQVSKSQFSKSQFDNSVINLVISQYHHVPLFHNSWGPQLSKSCPSISFPASPFPTESQLIVAYFWKSARHRIISCHVAIDCQKYN